MALILDTDASLDRSDADHQACRRLIESATESLIMPSPDDKVATGDRT